MSFFRYTGRRLLHLIPVLLGISILAFLLGVLSPGDPARMALSQGVNEPTQEEIEKKREELGLNAPLTVQYGCWISRALRGDLGTSYLTKKPVLEELKRRAPITVRVAFFSFLLVILIGVSGGIYLAAAKRGILYRLVNTLSVAVISIPGFCVALILIWVFSERLRILPTSGVSGWKSYVMPAMALALPNIGSIMRLTQSSIEKEMGKRYVEAAYSKGYGELSIIFLHVLRNSMIPVVTMAGNFLGGILGGAAVVEGIFSIPGLGGYALTAISGRDYPALQGYVLITGAVFVLLHFLVDLISYGLNPQIQLGEAR